MSEIVANSNPTIEKRVISTLLKRYRKTGLDEESFTDPYCKAIFKILDTETDPVSINVALSGSPALLEFIENLPEPLPDDGTSIDVLIELEQKRKNMDLIAEYADDPTELMLRLKASKQRGTTQSAYDMFNNEEEINQICSASPMRTHLPQFNKCVKIQPGEFIVISADTSAGKTQLGLNFAVDFASTGNKVFFATLEMNPVQLEVRLQNMFLKKPIWDIFPGPQFKADVKKMRDPDMMPEAARTLKNLHFYWQSPFFQDIVHQIDIVQPDVVIIDYFQIMSSRLSRGENEDQRYMALSLRALARDRPYIVLSQFKKKGKDDEERSIDDIYGTCALPQSASVSVFLNRKKSNQSVLLDEISYDVNKNRTWSTRIYKVPLKLQTDGMFVESA